jgi:peptidyl-prolyl cis-trans isomerase C
MKLRHPIAGCLALALVAAACESSPPKEAQPSAVAASPAKATANQAGDRVVARYGDKTLSGEELVVELERLPDRSRRMMNAESRKKLVENYILNELLFDEAERQGLGGDPEIKRQVEDLKKRLVVQKLVRSTQNVPPVSDAEVKAYYDANPDRYSTTMIKARHILVKDEGKANELLAKVKENPAQFADLAQANSLDTASARKGGDLGFFGRGRMVPEFEAAAFALKSPGDISGVVKTPYGYHIIELDEVRPGAQKPFDQVKEQIRATLRNQALQQRTTDLYDDLKRKANLKIDEVAIEEVAAAMPEPSPAAQGGLPPGHPPIGANVQPQPSATPYDD